MWKKEIELSNGKKLTIDVSGIGAREFRAYKAVEDLEEKETSARKFICRAVGWKDWEDALDCSEYDLRMVLNEFWEVMNSPFS